MLMLPASSPGRRCDAGEVREQGRALMMRVLALQAQTRCRAGCCGRWRPPRSRRAAPIRCRPPRAGAPSRHRRAKSMPQDLGVLEGLGAAGRRVVEQQLVQLFTAHVHRIAGARVQGAGEAKHAVAELHCGAGKSAPNLRRPMAMTWSSNAQALENRHVHRQQGFADVEAGVAALFHQRHAQTLARQQCRSGRTAGSAAHNQHVCAVRAVVTTVRSSNPGVRQPYTRPARAASMLGFADDFPP